MNMSSCFNGNYVNALNNAACFRALQRAFKEHDTHPSRKSCRIQMTTLKCFTFLSRWEWHLRLRLICMMQCFNMKYIRLAGFWNIATVSFSSSSSFLRTPPACLCPHWRRWFRWQERSRMAWLTSTPTSLFTETWQQGIAWWQRILPSKLVVCDEMRKKKKCICFSQLLYVQYEWLFKTL